MAQEPPLTLFAEPEPLTVRSGRIDAELVEAKSILTPATGFMADWDYTLNPYSGCGYGCNYCYAAFFSRNPERRDTWGDWVDVKQNAVELIRKLTTGTKRKAPIELRGKTIYMSSVTDPYQPVERQLGLTRAILEELIKHQPWLTIQTRGPLVTRDIDLLQQFDVAQVNMTVTTDSEEVRQAFEPHCSTNRKRLEAITEVADAGIDAAITMTPLLPIDDAEQFAKTLAATGARRFVAMEFHATKGRFVRSTRAEAIEMAKAKGWNLRRHHEVVKTLRESLPNLSEGQAGFAPPTRSPSFSAGEDSHG